MAESLPRYCRDSTGQDSQPDLVGGWGGQTLSFKDCEGPGTVLSTNSHHLINPACKALLQLPLPVEPMLTAEDKENSVCVEASLGPYPGKINSCSSFQQFLNCPGSSLRRWHHVWSSRWGARGYPQLRLGASSL